MKKQCLRTLVLFCGMVGAVQVQAAVSVDAKRIDAVVAEYKAQVAGAGSTLTKDQEQQFRLDIVKQLKQTEVLKKAAIAAGLNKSAQVQYQWQNVEAQFYAAKYLEFLKEGASISDAQLQDLYKRLARRIKIQQASFPTREDALKAKERLLKGMSFTQMLRALPQQSALPDEFIDLQMLPAELGFVLGGMNKGQITDEPVAFQGGFYLFKLLDVQKNDQFPPFEQVKKQLLNQKKDEWVQEQIQKLFKAEGLAL